MRYYTSRLPASHFCPTGYTSACWGWKPTEILEGYLASGTKTPWVLEDFLIVIQCGLKLCTSTRLQTFWMLWKSSQLKCRAEAQPICLHWLVVPRSFPCIPDHNLWFVPSFSLCLSGRWSLPLTAACFWDSAFPELFLQRTAQKPLHTCTSKQCCPGQGCRLFCSLLCWEQNQLSNHQWKSVRMQPECFSYSSWS